MSPEARGVTHKGHAAAKNGLTISLGTGDMYSGVIGVSGKYAFRSGNYVWTPVLTFGTTDWHFNTIGYSAGTVVWETIIRARQYLNIVELEFESNRLYGFSILPNYTYCSRLGI